MPPRNQHHDTPVTGGRRHYARGHARRQLLLDAAVDVIAERGLEGLTHRAVALRAGLPASSTGYFFASVTDLIVATVAHIADTMVADAEELNLQVRQGHVARAAIPERVVRLLELEQRRDVLVQFEVYLAAERHPDLQEAVARIIAGFERATQAGLEAIGVRDSAVAARQLLAVVDGFSLHRIAWRRDPDDAAVLQDTVRRLLESWLADERED